MLTPSVIFRLLTLMANENAATSEGVLVTVMATGMATAIPEDMGDMAILAAMAEVMAEAEDTEGEGTATAATEAGSRQSIGPTSSWKSLRKTFTSKTSVSRRGLRETLTNLEEQKT